MRDCPILKAQGRESNQAQTSSPSSDAPKKNHFNSLRSKGDQEDTLDVVTGMLEVFSINFYELLHHGAPLYLVNLLVFMKFNVLLDVLIEPFLVITTVGDSVVAKRLFRRCPIILFNRVTLVDLVELDMSEFDVILGMDSLSYCFDSIDCRTRVVKF